MTSRTVLCIEDDLDNITVLRRMLERLPGTEVRLASNARDGIEAAMNEQPALILLDNRLPDATGREVLRQLAGSSVTANIPVVVISGDVRSATIDELLAAGASDFLGKPFDIHRFLTLVEGYLD